MKIYTIIVLLLLSACVSVPSFEPILVITVHCNKEVSRLAISDDGTLLFVLSDDYEKEGVKPFIAKVMAQLAAAGKSIKIDRIDQRLNLKCGVEV